MSTFLAILLILAMIATVGALVRGIVIFLRTTEADLMGSGPSISSRKQNKAMQMRILFQALAVILVVLVMVAAGKG
jgi:uncharacterized membrane protein YjgN (DUF898 family)